MLLKEMINILRYLEKWVYSSFTENQPSKTTARTRGHGVEDIFISTYCRRKGDSGDLYNEKTKILAVKSVYVINILNVLFPNIYFELLLMCILWAHACEYNCPQIPEDVGLAGAGITSGYEPPDIGFENQTQVL